MSTKKVDPLERAMEEAFESGDFVRWREGNDFIENLENVKLKVDSLVRTGQAKRSIERIVSNEQPSSQPSFLEKARRAFAGPRQEA